MLEKSVASIQRNKYSQTLKVLLCTVLTTYRGTPLKMNNTYQILCIRSLLSTYSYPFLVISPQSRRIDLNDNVIFNLDVKGCVNDDSSNRDTAG